MPVITVMGGGSATWTLGLVKDLMHVFEEPLEIRLHDLNMKAVEDTTKPLLEIAAKRLNRQDVILPEPDRKKALTGADAIVITISTGGLAAMEHDLLIPEKYGIRATVADTTGPGGWSRSIRNIPVFRELARDFAELCPQAFIANYTNPMASLTATLQRECPNPSVGLCHAYFETKDVIQKIFELPDWSQISIEVAGMNHFTWVTDFKIGKEPGYPLLRKKLAGRSLRAVMPEESADEIGIFSRHNFCVELFDAYGYLPYPADRHTSEFVSCTLSGEQKSFEADDPTFPEMKTEVMEYCHLQRTSIEWRRKNYERYAKNNAAFIAGEDDFLIDRSRETGADMIHAYLYNKFFVDAVNCLNTGQVPNLPEGACVETLGNVDGLGVRPFMVKSLPDHLAELIRPIAICQKWITEGTLTGNRDMLLQALYRDPACAHLKPHEVRAMGEELFKANGPFLPEMS